MDFGGVISTGGGLLSEEGCREVGFGRESSTRIELGLNSGAGGGRPRVDFAGGIWTGGGLLSRGTVGQTFCAGIQTYCCPDRNTGNGKWTDGTNARTHGRGHIGGQTVQIYVHGILYFRWVCDWYIKAIFPFYMAFT